MKNRLSIELMRSRGALIRLLGLTERRGYAPLFVSAAPSGPDVLLVELTVESDRPLEQLTRQLAKLYDVERVEIHS